MQNISILFISRNCINACVKGTCKCSFPDNDPLFSILQYGTCTAHEANRGRPRMGSLNPQPTHACCQFHHPMYCCTPIFGHGETLKFSNVFLCFITLLAVVLVGSLSRELFNRSTMSVLWAIGLVRNGSTTV